MNDDIIMKRLPGLMEADESDSLTWYGWLLRVDNLIEAIKEIASHEEMWVVLEIVEVIKETLNSDRRASVDELFGDIDKLISKSKT